jgi:hypothetical protein
VAPLKADGVVTEAITRLSKKDSNPEEPPEVRSFGEKCRLQVQNAVASAISSTVLRLEGLSLLEILGMIE